MDLLPVLVALRLLLDAADGVGVHRSRKSGPVSGFRQLDRPLRIPERLGDQPLRPGVGMRLRVRLRHVQDQGLRDH